MSFPDNLNCVTFNGERGPDRLNVWYGFSHHNLVNLETIEGKGKDTEMTNVELERDEALRLAETILRAVRELDARQ